MKRVVLPDGIALTLKLESGYVLIGVDVGGEFIRHNPYGPATLIDAVSRFHTIEDALKAAGDMESAILSGVHVRGKFFGLHSLFGVDAESWELGKVGTTLEVLTKALQQPLIRDGTAHIALSNAVKMGVDPVACRSLRASLELL